MRGKEWHMEVYAICDRITPAYAGKSALRRLMCCMFKDHPRLCGEKVECTQFAKNVIGSPPPMRGKGLLMSNAPFLSRDHPRLCGEKCIH